MFPLAADNQRGLRSVPWVALFFFIAYLGVMFTYQLDEQRLEQELADWYVKSSLYQLEYPNYDKFLRFSGRLPLAEKLEQAHQAGDTLTVIRSMAFDPAFEEENRNVGDLYWDFRQRETWQQGRAKFEELASAIPRYRFGLVPSSPRPATYLTWHFLQENLMQWLVTLLVAALFLWPTEAKLGHKRMVVVWMFGGVITGMVYVAAMSQSFAPLIGATPMAAVIIGAYLSLFGLKKLDFAYFHPKQKKVKVVALPALVLAPLWIALPVYEYFGGSDAPHVWIAQLTGLLAGALLVQLAQRQDVKGMEEEESRVSDTSSQLRQHLHSGWASMSALEFLQAEESFRNALSLEPDMLEPLTGIYHVHKLKPESDGFHESAARVLELQTEDDDAMRQQYAIYKDYLRRAGDNARLSDDARILTVIRMIQIEEMREAEQLAAFITEDKTGHRWLGWMYRSLADAHDRFGNTGKANHYRGLASRADDQAPAPATA